MDRSAWRKCRKHFLNSAGDALLGDGARLFGVGAEQTDSSLLGAQASSLGGVPDPKWDATLGGCRGETMTTKCG